MEVDELLDGQLAEDLARGEPAHRQPWQDEEDGEAADAHGHVAAARPSTVVAYPGERGQVEQGFATWAGCSRRRCGGQQHGRILAC